MSQENIEVLRKAYELAESRGVEGLLDFATEDLVWISDPRFPGGGTHVGKENVRRWLLKLWIYDEVSIDIEQVIDLDDRALGITRFSGLSHDGPRVDWLWCSATGRRTGTSPTSPKATAAAGLLLIRAAGRSHGTGVGMRHSELWPI